MKILAGLEGGEDNGQARLDWDGAACRMIWRPSIQEGEAAQQLRPSCR